MLTGFLADLNAAPAAKRELAIMSAVEVCEALAQRRHSLRDGRWTSQ